MPMTTRALRSAACLSLCLMTACGGDGGATANSPTAPSGPGGVAPTTGAWTGTLTRPGDLGTLSLRWEATTTGSDMIGPLTLTNGAASVTVTARGITGGNDRQGYAIFITFNQNASEWPAAGCRVIAATVQSQTDDPFPAPYNRITIRALDISYSGCRGGLISTGFANPLSDFLQEIARLELSK